MLTESRVLSMRARRETSSLALCLQRFLSFTPKTFVED
jgi:hypothetical protein